MLFKGKLRFGLSLVQRILLLAWIFESTRCCRHPYQGFRSVTSVLQGFRKRNDTGAWSII